MKKSITLVAAFSIAAFTNISIATETGAGCGVGAEVMKGQKGKGPNIVAAILNGLLPNTFFMTTGGGILGCDPTKTVEIEQAKKTFVASNMDQLSTDAARGHGHHLMALGYLMGVKADDIAAFERLSQERYAEVFGADSSAGEILSSIDQAMSEDAVLTKYIR